MSIPDCSSVSAQAALRTSWQVFAFVFIATALGVLISLVILAADFDTGMLSAACTGGAFLSAPFFVVAFMVDKTSMTKHPKTGPRALCLTFKTGLALTLAYWLLAILFASDNSGGNEVLLGLLLLASPLIITPVLVVVYRRSLRAGGEA